jgi:hypothetical protein
MNMRISIWPKSLLGRWSVGLGAAFIVVFVLSGVLTALGGVGVGPAPVGPIAGVALGVAFGVSGIVALVTGLISIIKSKERSILVFVAVVAGLFCLIFFLGEFLVPH